MLARPHRRAEACHHPAADEGPWRFRRRSTPGASRGSRSKSSSARGRRSSSHRTASSTSTLTPGPRIILMNGIEVEAWNLRSSTARRTTRRSGRCWPGSARRAAAADHQLAEPRRSDDHRDHNRLRAGGDRHDRLPRAQRGRTRTSARRSTSASSKTSITCTVRQAGPAGGTDPNTIVQGKTDIIPAADPGPPQRPRGPAAQALREEPRPAALQAPHHDAALRRAADLHHYKNVGSSFTDPLARHLYAEIGEVEEEHVTFYGNSSTRTRRCLSARSSTN